MIDKESFTKRLRVILHWNYHALRAALSQGIPADSMAVDYLFRERAALKRRLKDVQNGV